MTNQTQPPLPTSRGLRVVKTADLRRVHHLLVFTILLDFIDLIVGLVRIHG
jgi:hypothetical protein